MDGFGQMGIATTRPDLLLLSLDINTVEARGVEAEKILAFVSIDKTEPVSLVTSAGISNAMNLSISHFGVQMP